MVGHHYIITTTNKNITSKLSIGKKGAYWWGLEILNTSDLDDTASTVTERNESQRVRTELYFPGSSSNMSANWLKWQWQLLNLSSRSSSKCQCETKRTLVVFIQMLVVFLLYGGFILICFSLVWVGFFAFVFWLVGSGFWWPPASFSVQPHCRAKR